MYQVFFPLTWDWEVPSNGYVSISRSHSTHGYCIAEPFSTFIRHKLNLAGVNGMTWFVVVNTFPEQLMKESNTVTVYNKLFLA